MLKTQPISPYDDVIDSRDILERIEWLTHNCSKEEAEELRELLKLKEECSWCSEFEHGETLIRETYFETYAQELAEDCGDMPDPNQWPGRCIDWKQAAHELAMDYSHVEFDGVTYLIRSC